MSMARDEYLSTYQVGTRWPSLRERCRTGRRDNVKGATQVCIDGEADNKNYPCSPIELETADCME